MSSIFIQLFISIILDKGNDFQQVYNYKSHFLTKTNGVYLKKVKYKIFRF